MDTTQAKEASAATARLRWTRRAGPLAAALLAIGLLAGCGGSSSVGTAQNGSASSKQKDVSQVVRYSQCMRAHGVTNFPDPTSGGALTLDKSTIESPQYQTASQACRSLAPAGSQSGASISPQAQAQALSFAHCMRSHGVPDFPDPSPTGGVVGFAVSHATRTSPAYSRAGQACRSKIPGEGSSITPTSGSGS